MELYETLGTAAYSEEQVSQTEHALQAAMQAVRAGAPEPMVAAALVHDIGHLLPDADDGALAASALDARHEARGAVFLGRHFRTEVVRPVGLHVTAKRYLCTVEPGYAARLSSASVRSLARQGGPLAGPEVRAFESRAGSTDAMALRRWDAAAKVPGLRVPGLGYYRPLLEACLDARRR